MKIENYTKKKSEIPYFLINQRKLVWDICVTFFYVCVWTFFPFGITGISVFCCSVAKSCLTGMTLCSVISWSLLKFMIIESVTLLMSNHVIICHPLLLWPSVFPSIRAFFSESALHIRWPKYWSFTFRMSPSNEIQGWFSLELTGLISLQSKGLSSTTVQKHQFFSTHCFFWSALASIHDYWKNHSFDHMDFCQQSDVSAL